MASGGFQVPSLISHAPPTPTSSLSPTDFSANLDEARNYNKLFSYLNFLSPCSPGHIGCIGQLVGICSSQHAFDLKACGSQDLSQFGQDEACFALPLVNAKGVYVGCANINDATSLLGGNTGWTSMAPAREPTISSVFAGASMGSGVAQPAPTSTDIPTMIQVDTSQPPFASSRTTTSTPPSKTPQPTVTVTAKPSGTTATVIVTASDSAQTTTTISSPPPMATPNNGASNAIKIPGLMKLLLSALVAILSAATIASANLLPKRASISGPLDLPPESRSKQPQVATATQPVSISGGPPDLPPESRSNEPQVTSTKPSASTSVPDLPPESRPKPPVIVSTITITSSKPIPDLPPESQSKQPQVSTIWVTASASTTVPQSKKGAQSSEIPPTASSRITAIPSPNIPTSTPPSSPQPQPHSTNSGPMASSRITSIPIPTATPSPPCTTSKSQPQLSKAAPIASSRISSIPSPAAPISLPECSAPPPSPNSPLVSPPPTPKPVATTLKLTETIIAQTPPSVSTATKEITKEITKETTKEKLVTITITPGPVSIDPGNGFTIIPASLPPSQVTTSVTVPSVPKPGTIGQNERRWPSTWTA
ncbi:hypothetical protein B0J14DRAFT_560098 [Halenospora varia]|nr:hypothetical protein B0J14DRAFT_560098 [Halenospora varia]